MATTRITTGLRNCYNTDVHGIVLLRRPIHLPEKATQAACSNGIFEPRDRLSIVLPSQLLLLGPVPAQFLSNSLLSRVLASQVNGHEQRAKENNGQVANVDGMPLCESRSVRGLQTLAMAYRADAGN